MDRYLAGEKRHGDMIREALDNLEKHPDGTISEVAMDRWIDSLDTAEVHPPPHERQ